MKTLLYKFLLISMYYILTEDLHFSLYGQYSNTSGRNSETITYNKKSKIQCYTEDLNLTKGKIKIVINVISPGTHSLRYE
jgi:hypothetical protein